MNDFERQAIGRAVRRVKLRIMVRRACVLGVLVLIVGLALANHLAEWTSSATDAAAAAP